MAEQEIIKHVEAAIAVSRDRTKKWRGTNWLEIFESTPMRFVMQSEAITTNIEAYANGIQSVGVLMKEIDEAVK